MNMQDQHVQLRREFDQKMKTLEKQCEDQIRDLNHAHKVEKHDMREKLRAEITQVSRHQCISVGL